MVLELSPVNRTATNSVKKQGLDGEGSARGPAASPPKKRGAGVWAESKAKQQQVGMAGGQNRSYKRLLLKNADFFVVVVLQSTD